MILISFALSLYSPTPQVRSGDIETEKRLRKDLKRTKALLADAQIMLDHIKNNAPSKREIAQLKNQVQPQRHRTLQNQSQRRMQSDQFTLGNSLSVAYEGESGKAG